MPVDRNLGLDLPDGLLSALQIVAIGFLFTVKLQNMLFVADVI